MAESLNTPDYTLMAYKFRRSNPNTFIGYPYIITGKTYTDVVITIDEDTFKKKGIVCFTPLIDKSVIIQLVKTYINAADNKMPSSEHVSSLLDNSFRDNMREAILKNSSAFLFKVDLEDFDKITGLNKVFKTATINFRFTQELK
jgi:hypothetical protein